MDAEAKASDGITRQLHNWSKDSDDPDSQAILLRNIMSNLAQRGSDPVQILSEISSAPGKDDGDGKDSEDDSSEESESSEEDDDDEEGEDEEDDDSSNEDETEGESEDDEDSATSSSGDSSEDESSSDGERVQVKFVCRGVPGRPDGEVRAAALKASCQWRRLQRQLWRDYGEECKVSSVSSNSRAKRHGVLHVSYVDVEGDECTVRSQRDLKVALRSHLTCTTASTAAATTVAFANTAVPPFSTNSAVSWAVPSTAMPTSLRLFVNGPNHQQPLRSSHTSRSALTMPRTTGLGLGAQQSPRVRAGDVLKRAHSDGESCLEVTSLSATVGSHEEEHKAHCDPPIMGTPCDELALIGRQTVAATTPAAKTPRVAADNTHSNNSNKGNRGDGGDPPLYWKRGSLLGRGAYGQVYAALDLRNGAWLAVKQVRLSGSTSSSSGTGERNQSAAAASPAANKDPKVVALQREISLLESLQHPNIIKYLGTQRTKRRLNIFLEYASEGSIGAALQKFGPLSEFVVRKYASQLLDGLAYLHDQGVIHRDIKASNVLVSKGVVKLADFGCSTRTSLTMQGHHHHRRRKRGEATGGASGFSPRDEEVGPRSEVQHSVVGTTIYMAPEVLKAEAENANHEHGNSVGRSRSDSDVGGGYGGGGGSNSGGNSDNGNGSSSGPGYGRKADVWSVGMLVLEMCSGSPPWRSASVAVYKACMTDELPPMPESLSSQGRDFVAQCLQRDPDQRPSAAALRNHPFCCWRECEVGHASPAALQAMLGSVRAMAGDDDDHEHGGPGQRSSSPLSPAPASGEESEVGARFRGLPAGLSALPLEAQDHATWSEGWGDLNNGGAAAAAAAKIELAASSFSQSNGLAAAAVGRQAFLTQEEGCSGGSNARNRAANDTEDVADEKYDDDVFEEYDENDEKEGRLSLNGNAEAKNVEPLLLRSASAGAEEKGGPERDRRAHETK